MTNAVTWQPSIEFAARLISWVNRALEALWLLTVLLVPLAFLDRGYSVSEAVIAYVEVPKVTLLRTLVGLIAVLWLIEWGAKAVIASNQPRPEHSWQYQPRVWLSQILGWLRTQPSRWLLVSVALFFASTLLSTILSQSFAVSLWGEIPGQDGYSAYTVTAYVVLFAAVATHLKTWPQVRRLLAAISVMGFLVGGLACLQHYGHNVFDLTELTGGGAVRVTSTMGNAIFAAAALVMTIPVTLVVAVLALPVAEKLSFKSRDQVWVRSFLIAAAGILILTVQLLGLTFTFSRGPWLGTLLALTFTLGLAAIFVGWAVFARTAIILGFAASLTLAVVQWNVAISSIGLWTGAIVVLLAVFGVVGVLGWRKVGQGSFVAGIIVMLAAAVFLIPGWFKEDANVAFDAPSNTTSAVERRIASINSYVASGFSSGRGDTWEKSWYLVRDRPWFEFDSLSFAWARPLVGYGPDLFRYAYLLVSTPQGGNAPVEPDHAHNFLIHQAVELGVLGFLSSLAIFVTVFAAGGYLLLRQRARFSPAQRLVLAGVVAIIAGRFLEMMVGVARVSDLTILWVVLAMFVALTSVSNVSGVPSVNSTEPSPSRRVRNQNTPGRSSLKNPVSWSLVWRLALVAWLVGGITILTWTKSVNYLRASVEVGEAVKEYQRGSFQDALSTLDRAIDLGPDVNPYYNYRAQVYFAYQVFDEVTPERECSLQDAIPYGGCLNVRSFESNLEGALRRPFYYRSRWALANSALNLKQDSLALRLYDEVMSMVPNSKPMRDDIGSIYIDLAEAYLEADRPETALKSLLKTEEFLSDDALRARALLLTGTAYRHLDRLAEAAESLESSLELPLAEDVKQQTHQVLALIYEELGESRLAEEHKMLGLP